jgi:4-hydroxy-3-methylbut-2-enyl diphosphate reductase
MGPLIHNPQVVQELADKGVTAVHDLNEIDGGTVIIRSHGVGPETIREAAGKRMDIVDATCPFVKKAQQLARELYEQGYQVVVVGDKEHPEVTGIVGWTENTGTVVESPVEAEGLPPARKYGVISQTTQPEENFNEIVRVLKEKGVQVKAYNTICHATRERQEEAVKLADKVEAMVVVGGKNSANTQKLARLCQRTGTPTYHIETAGELEKIDFSRVSTVGLTAGASTPDWIIEEVKRKMEEMNQQEKENEQTQMEKALAVRELHRGDIVRGAVVQVRDDEVLVDVGGKSEGVIPLRECSCCDIRSPKEMFNVGDEVEVMVIKVQDDEGKILLSKRKVDAEKAWEQLSELVENQGKIEGTVTEVVKGGLLLDVGIQAFLPASLVERGYVDNLQQYIGRTLTAKVIEVRRDARKVVLSRKAVLEEENEKIKSATWSEIGEGQVRKGIVKRLTNFGAFIDIGGIDGLLHVSEMAWHRVGHPSEVLKEGDEVEVFVLSIDREKEKVSLSLKKVLPSPWVGIAERYSAGKIVDGKVIRLAPFGAFIELEPGVDGLAHISQLSERRVNHPSDVLSVGQEVKAKIIEADEVQGKISITLKGLAEDQEKVEAAEYMEKQETAPDVTIGELTGAAPEPAGDAAVNTSAEDEEA